MKEILLVTTLLSIAMSENILMEKYLRPTMWMHDKQFWKTKRMPPDDIPLEVEESSNYDDRQHPYISDTYFTTESINLPSVMIRRPDLARFVQLFSPNKSKLDNGKQMILIIIGIQEKMNTGDDTQDKCSTENHNHNHNWLQQPIYVEEPRWIEINPNYIGHSRRPQNGDPYIFSRGKKIFRLKALDQINNNNYKNLLDYASKNKILSVKNRVRRFIEVNERLQNFNDAVADENKEDNEDNEMNHSKDIDKDTDNIAIVKMRKENEKSFQIDREFDNGEAENEKNKSTNLVLIERYKKDMLKNLAIESHRRKLTKRDQIPYNDIIIKNFIQQAHKTQRKNIEDNSDESLKIDDRSNYFTINMEKSSKKSALLKDRKFAEIHKKQETRENGWQDQEDTDKKKIIALQQVRNNIYIDKLDDISTYTDPFILSRGKKPFENGAENLDRKDINQNEFNEKRRKNVSNIKHYLYDRRFESETKNAEYKSRIEKDIAEATHKLANESDSKNLEIKYHSNYRKKRDAYKTRSELQQDQLLRNILKEIPRTPYVRPRDKHGQINDLLNLPADPYFIIRGKKVSKELDENLHSIMDNADRIRVINLSTEDFLRMLLMEKHKCNNRDINEDRLLNKLGPRDRRNSLDNILNLKNLKYDPFYVARGKRMNLGNFQSNRRSEIN